MTNSTRADLFADLTARIETEVPQVNPLLAPLEVEVFFADELLFASATLRGEDASVLWRSSHAATPDSTALPHLAEAGAELVDRILADAKLSDALERRSDD